MKKLLAKLTAVFTAAALTLGTSGIGEAAYAQTAAAISITLEKTVGTGILVTTATDRKLAVRDGMRLYNGYKVSTGVKSQAYLALDDKKAVKTDQLSRVQIKKEGRKNEIKVICGKLFFNVKEKLTKKETMKISTSNISMGIRGTSGSVAMEPVLDDRGNVTGYSQTVQIYDGSVQLETPGADTGEGLLVQAGEAATLTPGEDGSVAVEKKQMKPSDIPSFAGEEMLSDETLLARVEQESGFNVKEVQEGTESSRQEEEKQTELLTGLWENSEETGPEYYDKELSEESGDGKETDTGLPEGGGSGGGAVTTPAPAPTEIPTPVPTPTSTPVPTPTPLPTPTPTPSSSSHVVDLGEYSEEEALGAIKEALGSYSNISIKARDGEEETVTINEQIIIKEKQEVTIEERVTFKIGDEGNLENKGGLTNKGTIEIAGGHLGNPKNLTNNGTIKIESRGCLANSYYLINAGGEIQNRGTIQNSREFINSGIFRQNASDAAVDNQGTITSSGFMYLEEGSVENRGTIKINEDRLGGPIVIWNIDHGKVIPLY